ncbi:hypothetical protein D0Z03_001708 [Geotrichum reessii]|nr:hypothetical protein D0Z03_001708 [Galactomyces reessii]
MPKRPQGLHKAALAKKKQKTEASTKEVSEEIENVEENEEIIQFGEEVDPNDEISSLYAIYKKYLTIQENQEESNDKKDKEENLKYINLMINTCDTILRLHEKKQENASKNKDNETEPSDTEKSKMEEPIDFIPLQLPNKVYHIYAFALLTRGRILLDMESFLIRFHREDKIGEERAIGFFELGLDMLENSTDLSGSVTNTDAGDAFFIKSWGTVLVLQEKLVNKIQESVRNYSTEVELLVQKAKDMFTEGLKLVKDDQAITEACWNAIDLLQQLGDNIYSIWNCTDVKTDNQGDVLIYGYNNKSTYEKFLNHSTDLLTWTHKQYQSLQNKAQSSDNKARAISGIASFHLLSATPYIDQYDEIAQGFEINDDSAVVRKLQKNGEKQLKDSISMFEKAEKMYTDKAENNRNRLLVTIAEAKLSLRDLLTEIDYLPGESKKERASRDKLREELKVDAVMRLKKAERLGLGDFTEVLDDVDHDSSDDDEEDDDDNEEDDDNDEDDEEEDDEE